MSFGYILSQFDKALTNALNSNILHEFLYSIISGIDEIKTFISINPNEAKVA
jgi:hypothetical protein